MKAIMVMYDSLNREMLESYGCNWTKTPNFKRLAEKCVQFEQCYVGSMPCMPARRELQTGRIDFFHRSWSVIISITGRTVEQLITTAIPHGRLREVRRAITGKQM